MYMEYDQRSILFNWSIWLLNCYFVQTSPHRVKKTAAFAGTCSVTVRGGKYSSLWRTQELEEADDRFNTAVEIGNMKLLVGGVQVIVGQAKAHHHAGNVQVLVEIRDDWD